MAFTLGTVLIFLRKSSRVRFIPPPPLCILPIAWFSNFNFVFEHWHHTSPILGGGEKRTRKSTVIHITSFPRQRTKIPLAKYQYFYATKIQLGSQLNFTNFTRGSLLAQDSRRNSQGLSLKSSALSLSASAATERGERIISKDQNPNSADTSTTNFPYVVSRRVQTGLTPLTEVFHVHNPVWEVGCSSGGSWTRRTDWQTASTTGLSAFSEYWHLPKKRAFRFN